MAKGVKTGGRKKGTSNALTADVRKCFNELVSNNMEKLQDDLNKLKPNERVKAVIDMAKFVIPQLKAVDLKTDPGKGSRPQFVFVNKVKVNE